MVAPGSRSTPLALAVMRNPTISVEVFHDERTAGFAALGVGLATGVPAVVVCSSGTAAAHFFAPVIEASLSCVPMIVCTADRPPHLRDVGAPQTVDQTKMFGDAVRWFHDPGVPTAIPATTWRALASRTFDQTQGIHPGPVHLNLPFDEPLYGDATELPIARPKRWSRSVVGDVVSDPVVDECVALFAGRQGIFVAGKKTPSNLCDLAHKLGWPVFADPRSGVRHQHNNVIAAFDSLLRIPEMKQATYPDVVVCVGEPPASKVLSQWLASVDCDVVQLQEVDRVIDPLHRVSHRYVCDVQDLFARVLDQTPAAASGEWLNRWAVAEKLAQSVIDDWTGENWSEIAVSRTLSRAALDESQIMVSSSMPIRDCEWFGSYLQDVTVLSNRGANGIDGVMSTAIGAALATTQTTYVLIGDVAFLHDSNALLGLAIRGTDVRVVVTNNDGGSIFSFLPQAGLVTTDEFELMYGTPHGVKIESLCQAHGLVYHCVNSVDELMESLQHVGPIVIEARFDRGVNVGQHDAVNTAIQNAVMKAMA